MKKYIFTVNTLCSYMAEYFCFQILIAYYTCTLKLESRKRRNYKVQKKKERKNVRKGNIQDFLNVALF